MIRPTYRCISSFPFYKHPFAWFRLNGLGRGKDKASLNLIHQNLSISQGHSLLRSKLKLTRNHKYLNHHLSARPSFLSKFIYSYTRRLSSSSSYFSRSKYKLILSSKSRWSSRRKGRGGINCGWTYWFTNSRWNCRYHIQFRSLYISKAITSPLSSRPRAQSTSLSVNNGVKGSIPTNFFIPSRSNWSSSIRSVGSGGISKSDKKKLLGL